MSEIFRFRAREGVIALALLTGVAGLVLSVVAIARDSKTTTTAISGPVSGVYADGPTSVPHYFVTFLNRGDGEVRGAMNFFFQDGQTSVVFTFNGWIASLGSHSTSGTLTLSAAGVKNSKCRSPDFPRDAVDHFGGVRCATTRLRGMLHVSHRVVALGVHLHVEEFGDDLIALAGRSCRSKS